jgi:hypothetical protein
LPNAYLLLPILLLPTLNPPSPPPPLLQFYEAAPDLRGVVLMAMAAAGRGGDGDMGQRVRDEILVIQSRNNCKVRLGVGRGRRQQVVEGGGGWGDALCCWECSK